MSDLVLQWLAWYVTVQVIGLLALPLAFRVLGNLPDRGYGLARILGILLAGYILWVGFSFGLLRYEPGSAWLAVLVMGALSLAAGWPLLRQWRAGRTGAGPRERLGPGWRYIVVVEALFLVAFVAWALVRAHDPAANHTEKPMDLMFMNSIRSSAVYPPMDVWLAGHPISYYYFGYWLLTTVGMLAGQPPQISFNVGQACWYALLLTGCFAVGYNLVAALRRSALAATAGGLLAAIMVGVAANLQGLLEWLFANGVNVGPVAALLGVAGFPSEAAVTNQWFVDYNWWWWRSSRALEDLDLSGNHIEVIDEFPAFSYILGDNHPHVLAMPFVLLVIGLALNVFLAPRRKSARVAGAAAVAEAATEDLAHVPAEAEHGWRHSLRLLYTAMPLTWIGWLVTAVAAGSLLFLNTWDFPPYWLLLMLALFAVLLRRDEAGERIGIGHALGLAVAGGIALAAAALALYVPYFLTAQSQAGGFVPNLFNPSKLGQFVAMWATALLLIVALIIIAWTGLRPRLRPLLVSLVVVYGLPLLFVTSSALVATNTQGGRELLATMQLPPTFSSYMAAIVARWSRQFWTFALVGGLLALVAALGWTRLVGENGAQAEAPAAPEASAEGNGEAEPALLFVLMLAGIGLLLVYAPEFVFLRDNFGSRMNTVFKFYYQAWLLFGLAGAVTIVVALRSWRGLRAVPAVLASVALVIALASSVYLLAGAYGKAGGFKGEPTFDATAYLKMAGPDELAAVQWVRENTAPTARIAEAKGQPYRAESSRISAMTGRPTLLGWDGHEAQWRGKAYGQMAAGRPEALETLYRSGSAAQIAQVVDEFNIDYVYVGPVERETYGITPPVEARIASALDLVFNQGNVRIYRAR